MRTLSAGVLGIGLYVASCALLAAGIVVLAGIVDTSPAVAAALIIAAIAAGWIGYDRRKRRRDLARWDASTPL